MTAEFDSTTIPEPHKMSGASPAAPTNGQKLSIFAAKSGFVIPKNKLSGSLVPIFRGAKKHGVTGAVNGESSKQIERRSKWGPDLTQDTAVKRAKALALQIRVDQITKQLESEKLEVGDAQDLPLVAENPDQSKSGPHINSKMSDILEIEKREAIGEILKLDPSYKPPSGFKPLLKEVSVPFPVLEYPGYNFVGLIYGPEGDNQKRLEEETGAKIKIVGTKSETGEKVEIKPGSDIRCSYEEMHINISADSFDKVDAAVSIIELLVSSVIGNLASGATPPASISRDSTYVPGQSQGGPSSHAVSLTLEDQAVLQPLAVTKMHREDFQYSGPWFSVVPSHTPVLSSSGSIALSNSPGHTRVPHFPLQSTNPSNLASTFGAQPVLDGGLRPVIPNQNISMPSPAPRLILQHSHMTQPSPLGHIGPPRNPSALSLQDLSAPINASLSFPVASSQPTPIGQLQTSTASMPQPMSLISPIANQPMTPLGVYPGQKGAPVTIQMSVGLGNMGPMAPLAIPPIRPVSLHQQLDVAFKPSQPNMSIMPRPTTISPHQAGISPGPPSSLGPMPLPIPAPTLSSVSNLPGGPVSFPSIQLPQQSGVPISPSIQLPQQSGVPIPASGVPNYHTHANPPVSMTSNSGNFTFQSHWPSADCFRVVSRPNSQATTMQGGTQEQVSGPRPPPFGFAVPDQPLKVFPRTQFPNQLDQTQGHFSVVSYGGRSDSVSIPPRHNAFPYAGQPAPGYQVPQMGMKNIISASRVPNLPSPGVQRGMHIGQNYRLQKTWPDTPMLMSQKFGNNQSMASGKPAYPADQIYDPFSPTSVAPPQQ